MSAPHDPAAAMDFRLLGQHENEFVRQLREHARRHRKARAGGGHVAQMAGADRFAVIGTHKDIPSQSLAGTATALDGHLCNLRKHILFAKTLTERYFTARAKRVRPGRDDAQTRPRAGNRALRR
jgi:hypothetical protein